MNSLNSQLCNPNIVHSIKSSLDEINATNNSGICMSHHDDESHTYMDGEMTSHPRYHSVGTSDGNAFNISTAKLCNDDIIIKSVNNSDKNISLDGMSRLELDSHANMPVVGGSSQILAKSGETVDVNAYSPEYESRQVPLVAI